MITEAYLAGSAYALEKLALNALKARQMAKGFGLIPEGQWKWGLRNLRQGKTPQQLGMAPEGLIQDVRRLGSENEAGAVWGRGISNHQVDVGNPQGVDIGGEGARLAQNTEFMDAVHKTMADPTLKNTGRIASSYKKHIQEQNPLNTIHSHPQNADTASIYQMEKDTALAAREAASPNSQTSKMMQAAYASKPQGYRMPKLIRENQLRMADAIEHRYRTGYPALMPSGYRTRSPYNVSGTDNQRFLMHDIGTHHNIVSPGVGVGVHTVRPSDTAPEGRRMRSLLFKEKL